MIRVIRCSAFDFCYLLYHIWNDSSNIPYVIKKIAEIKGTTPDEVERKTRANAFELFTRVSD